MSRGDGERLQVSRGDAGYHHGVLSLGSGKQRLFRKSDSSH